MKQKSYEFWIGLVVIVSLVMLAVLIAGFGEFEYAFAKPYRVTAYFHNSAGIKRRASVRMLGVDIGEVERVSLIADERPRVAMVLKVKGDLEIKRDAVLRIRQEGLIANFFLEFDEGSPDAPSLPKDGTAKVNGLEAFSIEEALTKMSSATDKLTTTADGFDRLMTSLNKIADDEDFQNDVKTSARNIKEAAQNISEVAERGKATLEKIENASDEAGKLFNEVAAAIGDIKDTVASVKTFTGKLEGVVDRQGESADELIRKLNSNSEALDKLLQSLVDISESVRQGRGTMGKIVKDDEIHREVTTTLKEAREMMASVKQTIEYIEKHPESLLRGRKEKRKKLFGIF